MADTLNTTPYAPPPAGGASFFGFPKKQRKEFRLMGEEGIHLISAMADTQLLTGKTLREKNRNTGLFGLSYTITCACRSIKIYIRKCIQGLYT